MIRIGMPATLLRIPIVFFHKRTRLPWTGHDSGWICRVSLSLPSPSEQANFDCRLWISCSHSLNAQAVLHLLQAVLHLLQGDSLSFRVEEQHDEKLHHHHDCK